MDSVTESTGVDQTLDKAPIDLQRMRGTMSDVVCPVESPSRVRVLSDFELLYCTLVADSAVPAGYLTDFMKLEEHAHRAASRALNKYVSITEAAASMDLERYRKLQDSKESEDRALSDQLVMFAELLTESEPSGRGCLMTVLRAGETLRQIRGTSTFVFCQRS